MLPRFRSLFWLVPLLLGLLGCSKDRAAPRPESVASGSRRAGTTPGSCDKPPAKSGERRLQVGARTGLFVVSVPSGYDGTRRYPLGFAFHGRNRNHLDCQRSDCAGVQSVIGEHAVLVYLQSLREPLDRKDGGWEWPTERDDNVRFFEAVWAQVTAELCIDDQRVFLTGTSSGGTFANWLSCLHGEKLLAVAPVSGGFLSPSACQGAPAALVIHGIDDPHVPLAGGILARDSYRERSKCSATLLPELDRMHAEVRKARGSSPSRELARCVDYPGCERKGGPALRWCEHSYGGYDGSTHGWPPVGGQLLWDFVSAL